MSGKYDEYWENRFKEIKKLIKDALSNGHSKEIDVTDIKELGERNIWGTHVTIPPGATKITEELSHEAHGKSLGNVIISSGILKNVKEALSGKISARDKKLFLHFETPDRSKDKIVNHQTGLQTQHWYWAEIGEDKIIFYSERFLESQGKLLELEEMRKEYWKYRKKVHLSSENEQKLRKAGIEVLMNPLFALQGRWHWFTGHARMDAFALSPEIKEKIDKEEYFTLYLNAEKMT